MGRNTTYLAMAAVVVLATGCSDVAAVTTTAVTVTPTTTRSVTTVSSVATTTIPPATVVPSSTTSLVADGVVTIQISVVGGELVSERRAEVTVGDTVLLIVESDVADELHVHGYELIVDLVAGEPAELEFVAEIPGVFEVEFETSHLQVLELVVNQ